MWPVAWLELLSVGDVQELTMQVGDRFPLDPLIQTIFGRARDVSIRARHPLLNHRNFGVRFDGTRWVFSHFQGTHPCVLNGERGWPTDRTLRDGDLISPVEGLVFRFGDGKPSAAL
jgi:hypothetical protein